MSAGNGQPPKLCRRAGLAIGHLASFIETYFTDEKGRPVRLSAGQKFVCNQVERGTFGAGLLGTGIEMARGHGKSMIMKSSIILAFLRSYYLPEQWGARYAAILTSGMLYKQFSNDIAGIVTGIASPLVKGDDGRPLLLSDFWIKPANIYPERKNKERQLWNVKERLIYVGTWDHACRLSVRGMTGGRGDVRGLTEGNQRPDMLVVDDPMKESEADNVEITDKVKEFIKNSYIPCGSPDARLAFWGTPFNDHDLITEICGNATTKPLETEWPNLARACLPVRHPKSGALLCPQIWNDEKLEYRRTLVGTRAYKKEYELDPSGGGVKFFEPAWIEKWQAAVPPQNPQKTRIVRLMHCDPSLGRNSKSDCSAITILDYDTLDKVFYVVHVDMQRRRPQKLVADYLDLWEKYRPDKHAIEDEGAQELLIPIFVIEIKNRELPIEATPRLQSAEGLNKVTRIKTLSQKVEFGKIRWSNTGSHRDLRVQAVGWEGKENEPDDGLDSLEGCVRLAGEEPPPPPPRNFFNAAPTRRSPID
jgi:predicted phage terminase large subunit-like protein